MLNKIRVYSEIGPAIYFALLAAFCATIYFIEINPSAALLWKIYFVFAPFMRVPVDLLIQHLDMNVIEILAITVFAAFSGFFAVSRRYFRFRFFYFHLALLLIFTANIRQYKPRQFLSQHQRHDLSDPVAQNGYFGDILHTIVGWYPVGIMLFVLVSLACISWHVNYLRRVHARWFN
jgi:hypothetical protein